ncbi:MAG: TM2 domain-containing protein [Rikenellaceae bacterium]|nr:TM2 domain-containing protein [Rikenellaceae bacterium]MCL2692614.1 TM2 domain-containing protein [Rikenellaceae bacterium]
MEQSKVDLWLMVNAGKFPPESLPFVREQLERMPDNRLLMLQAVDLRDTTMILVIAIFLGWERFWLNDVGLGILKILTCQGLGIWWLVDIFTATNRTRKYNLQKFMSLTQTW